MIMSTLAINDYLKYANLQMATEAFIRDERTNLLATERSEIIARLIAGNGHASRFTQNQADSFAEQWEVLDQKANTATGFSGTLFKAIKDNLELGIHKDDLVLSFRSTEFLDDAARDNEATNKLEIGDFGFAFGQLADMETWYAKLQGDPSLLKDKAFSVTGYSLGGHLATAFNLLHPGAAEQVVTFNGAGVGTIGDGSLAVTYDQLPLMVAKFQDLREEAAAVGHLESHFTTSETLTAYRAIKAAMAANGELPSDSMLGWTLFDESEEILAAQPRAELQLLGDALLAAIKVTKEADRAPRLPSGRDAEGNENTPQLVALDRIDGDSLEYQLAVRITAQQFHTSPLALAYGALNIRFGKTRGDGWQTISNQYDLVGTETTTTPWAMVANSQYHYGVDAQVFIEDQPLYRGTAPRDFVLTSYANFGIKPLVANYNQNDFGDTHSLVLIVDSLSVQNLLKTLAPSATQAEIETLFKAASAARAESIEASQGHAEGDVLENIINSLSTMLQGAGATTLVGTLDGNTWASSTDRTALHNIERGNTLAGHGGDDVRDVIAREKFDALAPLPENHFTRVTFAHNRLRINQLLKTHDNARRQTA
jgi:pimeloyl-ACP methyl ester carboxylesterase